MSEMLKCFGIGLAAVVAFGGVVSLGCWAGYRWKIVGRILGSVLIAAMIGGLSYVWGLVICEILRKP